MVVTNPLFSQVTIALTISLIVYELLPMFILVPLLENVAGELDVISVAEYCLLPLLVVMVSFCADAIVTKKAVRVMSIYRFFTSLTLF